MHARGSTSQLLLTAGLLVAVLSAGCEDRDPNEPPNRKVQLLTPEEERTLNFEEVTDWIVWSGSGTIANSSLRSEGTASVAVSNIGYAGLRNTTPITKDEHPAPAVVGYDVWIPVNQVNPYWHGDTQLYIDAPSAGIWQQYLGYRSFNDLPKGEFTRVEFPLPDWIRQALDNSQYADLRFVVAINVEPGSATHYVDRFILGPDPGNQQCIPVSDNNPCTADECNPATGQTTYVPLAPGAMCSNGNACDGNESCDGEGVCQPGTPPELSDENPCTVDSCDPETGVTHTPATAGTACPDGDLCSGDEYCDAEGACQPGLPIQIEDENPCTADACDPIEGVTHTPVAEGTSCADGNLCNGAEICSATGACEAGAPLVAEDGNECTIDSCDPETGVSNTPVPSGTSCDDGDVCNGISTCDASATCVAGTPPLTDDENECTADSCDPILGVVHTNVAAGVSCGDGDSCNGSEACDGAGSCQAGAAPEIDDGNVCTVDACDPVAGVSNTPVAEGTTCGVGNACTGAQICDGAAMCKALDPVDPDDGDPCTTDSCDPVTGEVSNEFAPSGTDCSNGDPCDGQEQCDGAGACVSGSPVNSDDQNPCTVDSCDPVLGVVHEPAPVGTSCEDGDFCDGEETCDTSGQCVSGEAVIIDDGDPCTIDSCTNLGIEHEPAPPGAACADSCGLEGQCSETGECQLPAFGDECSRVVCVDGEQVTAAAPTGTDCGDGDVCNGAETCNGLGECQVGNPLSTDDQNACTADSCDPLIGVVHVPLPGQSCSDGDLCNGAESCNEFGSCEPGVPVEMNDGNPCTVDSCSPASGAVSHLARPAGTSCSDQDFCNGLEVCNGSGDCLTGNPPPIDDGDPCTLDSCDPAAGVTHEWQSSETCSTEPSVWRTARGSRPSPRDSSAVAHDASRNQTFVFGGNNAGAVLGDAWMHDGVSGAWRPIEGPQPSARTGAALVYEPANDRLTMFGGIAEDRRTFLADTWIFDLGEETWTKVSDDGPSPRAYASLSHNTDTGATILYGGMGTGDFGDLWRLEGVEWTQLGATGPEQRWGASLTYDPVRGNHLLFGGATSLATSGVYGDAWAVDDQTGAWTPVQPSVAGAEPRVGHLARYSAERGGVVVSGGVGEQPGMLEAWLLASTAAEWSSVPEFRSEFSGSGHAGDTEFGGLLFSPSGLFTPQSAQVTPRHQLTVQGAAPARLKHQFDGNTSLLQNAAFDEERGVWVVLASTAGAEYEAIWEYNPSLNTWEAKDPLIGFDLTALSQDFHFFDAPLTYWILTIGSLFSAEGGVWAAGIYYPNPDNGERRLALRQWTGDRFENRCLFPDAAAGGWFYSADGFPIVVDVDGDFPSDDFSIDPQSCTISSQMPALRAEFDFDNQSTSRLLYTDEFYLVARSVPRQTGGVDHVIASSTGATQVLEANPRSQLVYESSRDRVVWMGIDATWATDRNLTSIDQLNVLGPDGPPGEALLFFDGTDVYAVSAFNGGVWRLDENDEWVRRWGVGGPTARSGMAGGWWATQGYGLAYGGVSGDGHRNLSNELWLYDGEWKLLEGWNQQRRLSFEQRDPLGGNRHLAPNPPPPPVSGHAFGVGASFQGMPFAALVGGETDNGYGPSYLYLPDERDWRPSTGGLLTIDGAIALLPNPANPGAEPMGYFYSGGFTYSESDPGVRIPTDEHSVITLFPTTWPYHPSIDPPARYGHAMATDMARSTIVMFGGRDEDQVFSDTWILDTTSNSIPRRWVQLSTDHAPSPRFGHTMTFDDTLDRIVLIGGVGETSEDVLDDSWTWNFETMDWEPLRATGLVPRSDHLAMYDTGRNELVVFGGAVHANEGRYVASLGDTQVLTATLTETSNAQGIGSRCTDSTDCATGHCVDGVCCSSACDQICGSCAERGSVGYCVAVDGEPRGSRGECSSGEDNGCGLRCNGSAYECTPAPVGQTCGLEPGCYGEIAVVDSGACTEDGSCAMNTLDCTPYVCRHGSPPSCRTSCTSATGCAPGNYCAGPLGFQTCRLAIETLTADPSQPAPGESLTISATGPAVEYVFSYEGSTATGELPFTSPCGPGTTGNSCTFVVPPDAISLAVTVEGRINSFAPFSDPITLTFDLEAN